MHIRLFTKQIGYFIQSGKPCKVRSTVDFSKNLTIVIESVIIHESRRAEEPASGVCSRFFLSCQKKLEIID